jgi:hypothetical protein
LAKFRGEPADFDDVKCIAETTDAILVVMDDGKEHWIPKSQVHDDSEVYEKGGEGKLIISQWIAEEKGLV